MPTPEASTVTREVIRPVDRDGGGIATSAIGESLLFMWTENGEEVIPQMKTLFLGNGEHGQRH